jgi:hypothetical protein
MAAILEVQGKSPAKVTRPNNSAANANGDVILVALTAALFQDIPHWREKPEWVVQERQVFGTRRSQPRGGQLFDGVHVGACADGQQVPRAVLVKLISQGTRRASRRFKSAAFAW